MTPRELKALEIELLISAIDQRYKWDFTHYKKASFKRRLQQFTESNKLEYISELIPRLIYDESFFEAMVSELSVPVSEIFRDPDFYLQLRNMVIPTLRTYPSINIWHAGCAKGKEVYSTAIMLFEEDLYNRCSLTGTDINKDALKIAVEGIYESRPFNEYQQNYTQAGGKKELDYYFHKSFENMIIDSQFKKNVKFLYHNLVSDPAPGKMHLIMCRNVFIYFERELQDQIINLFLECLHPGGFLCLGNKESLRFSKHANQFETIDEKQSIYRKLYT